jgi:anti-sigma B factor antagonist
LNAVLECHEAGVAAGTSVRLVADHGEVLQPIKVTELDRILDIYPTVSDALQHNKSAQDAQDAEDAERR